QEYVQGRPFATAYSMDQAARNRIGEIIYRFAFGSIYRYGLFNGDPHPGNYLLLDDGTIAFVDDGGVAEFSADAVAGSAKVVRAVQRRPRPGELPAARRRNDRVRGLRVRGRVLRGRGGGIHGGGAGADRGRP